MREVPEPVDVRFILEQLRSALKGFESAFGQGPINGAKSVNLLRATQELRAKCEKFDEFLKQYEGVLCGLLWAHHPEDYSQEVYPLLSNLSVSNSTEPNQGETVSRRPRRTMIEVVEEVFAARNNAPLSVRELVPELELRGIHFRAKDPEKSLAQAMRVSGKFKSVSRGLYRLKSS